MEKRLIKLPAIKPVIKCNIFYNKINKQLNASLAKKPLRDILKDKIPKKLKIKDYEFEF